MKKLLITILTILSLTVCAEGSDDGSFEPPPATPPVIPLPPVLASASSSLFLDGGEDINSSEAGDHMSSTHNWNIGSSNQALFNVALAEARAEQNKAAIVGCELDDIGKFIKSAKKAMDAGDWPKSEKLLKKASNLSRLVQQQAIDQVEVGPVCNTG